jgi:hypothetical protein
MIAVPIITLYSGAVTKDETYNSDADVCPGHFKFRVAPSERKVRAGTLSSAAATNAGELAAAGWPRPSPPASEEVGHLLKDGYT